MKQNDFTRALAQSVAPAGEAVTVADHEGYIIEANEAVERVYRWPRSQIIRQHALKFCPDTPEWKSLSENIWNSIKVHGVWDGVVINVDANGRQFPILLRTRKVVHNRLTYVISWARPFPTGAPFGLSEQEARVFVLLGQGYGVPDIAVQLPNKDRSKKSPKTIKGVHNSTVNEHLRRIWMAVGMAPGAFSTSKIRLLAIRCLEAGWDSRMKINSQIPSESDGKKAKHPGKVRPAIH